MAAVRSFSGSRPAYQTAEPGRTVLFHKGNADYDQIKPVEMIGAFNRFLLEVISRYEGNDQTRQECEQKSQSAALY